jgi:hypothetical protein
MGSSVPPITAADIFDQQACLPDECGQRMPLRMRPPLLEQPRCAAGIRRKNAEARVLSFSKK